LFTLGFVIEEQGVEPVPGRRREGFDVAERARALADYPLTAVAGAEIFSDFDRHFEASRRPGDRGHRSGPRPRLITYRP